MCAMLDFFEIIVYFFIFNFRLFKDTQGVFCCGSDEGVIK